MAEQTNISGEARLKGVEHILSYPFDLSEVDSGWAWGEAEVSLNEELDKQSSVVP